MFLIYQYDSTDPIGTVEPLSVISIACGEYHSMALDGRGQLYTWGCNTYGQLGKLSNIIQIEKNELIIFYKKKLGRVNCPLGPRPVSQISHRTIAQICCGYNHSMALTHGKYIYLDIRYLIRYKGGLKILTWYTQNAYSPIFKNNFKKCFAKIWNQPFNPFLHPVLLH